MQSLDHACLVEVDKKLSKCWKTLICIKHLLNSDSAHSYLHSWSFKDNSIYFNLIMPWFIFLNILFFFFCHMFFMQNIFFSSSAGTQEVIHEYKFLLNLNLITSRRMFNAVSCPTSQTIHQIVSYAWIVPLHT